MDAIRKYIKKHISNGYDKSFADYLRIAFEKTKVADRYAKRMDNFPDQFEG